MHKIAVNNLKWFANVLRCVLHASIPYMVTKSDIWPVDETPGLLFLDGLVFNIHSFIMELFYILAGYTTVQLYYKLPLTDFLNNRLKRIVIPFIAGLVILMPVVISFFSFENLAINTPFHFFQNIKQIIGYTKNNILSNNIPTAHLWFLYYLILFYVCFVLLEKTVSFTKRISINRYHPYWLIVIISLGTSTCMFFMKRWFVDNPISLVIELPSFIHYFIFFMFGTILPHAGKFVESLKNKWKRNLCITMCLMIVATTCQYFFSFTNLSLYSYIKVIGIVSHSVLTVFALFTIIGLFYVKYNYTNRVFQVLCETSYWTYLLFLPLTMIFHIVLAHYQLPLILKFMISLIVPITICIVTYYAVVNKTFLLKYVGLKSKQK